MTATEWTQYHYHKVISHMNEKFIVLHRGRYQHRKNAIISQYCITDKLGLTKRIITLKWQVFGPHFDWLLIDESL